MIINIQPMKRNFNFLFWTYFFGLTFLEITFFGELVYSENYSV
jgi:hypothetical protein